MHVVLCAVLSAYGSLLHTLCTNYFTREGLRQIVDSIVAAQDRALTARSTAVMSTGGEQTSATVSFTVKADQSQLQQHHSSASHAVGGGYSSAWLVQVKPGA